MRCFNCMKKIPDKASFCPYCGKNVQIQNPSHCLSSGTVLSDRYEVGAVIGEGGFGITYTGYDQMLELKVAIKEFYPTGIANRNNTVSSKIVLTTSKHTNFYQKGKQKFLDEARNIALFSDEDGIVDVRDYFTENDTAYIVMEYLDGVDLREYLSTHGTIDAGNTFEMMLPLMCALEKMHKQGIIHRDIAPDNIMRLNNGNLKLTDFGSARYYLRDEAKTMSIFLKQGYSPIEQFGNKTAQGPWTDVYSLCATMYQCITGTVPPNSLDRSVLDELKTPSELGIDIPAGLENVLMKGLAVKSADRLQDMGELINAAEAEQIKTFRHLNPDTNDNSKNIYSNNQAEGLYEKTKSADDSGIIENPIPGARETLNKPAGLSGFPQKPVDKKPSRKNKTGFIVSMTIIGTLVTVGLIALPFYFMQNKNDSTSTVETNSLYSEPPSLKTPAPNPAGIADTEAKTTAIPTTVPKTTSAATSKPEAEPTTEKATEPKKEEQKSSAQFERYLVWLDLGVTVYESPDFASDVTYVIDIASNYTIVDEAHDRNGNLWGKLKSGVGWVCLSRTYKEQEPTTKAFERYLVWLNLGVNIHEQPDRNSQITYVIDEASNYTIVAEAYDSSGNLWGKLKSGVGWVNLSQL